MAEKNFILPSPGQTDMIILLHHHGTSENPSFSQSRISNCLFIIPTFLIGILRVLFVLFFGLRKNASLLAFITRGKLRKLVCILYPYFHLYFLFYFAVFSMVSLDPLIYILDFSFLGFTSSVKQVPVQNPKIGCSVLSFDNLLPTLQSHIYSILYFFFVT